MTYFESPLASSRSRRSRMARQGGLRSLFFVGSAAAAVAVAAWAGCSSQGGSGFTAPMPSPSPGAGGGDDGGGNSGGGNITGGGGNANPSGAFDFDASYPPPPCSEGDAGLAGCIDKSCGSSPTTLTGKVYDPAGKNPIYNVVVYVPRDPMGRLAPVTTGTSSCNTCDAQVGDYVAVGLTDESGTFTLPNVPTGKAIPVVFQIGKWRSETRVTTSACKSTTVPAAQSRLPRNQAEGSIPQMAILTGGCDYLPCFMIDMGLDPNEFTGPGGNGRLHMYRGDTGNGGIAGMVGAGPDLAGGGGGTAGDCTSSNAGKCPLWSQKTQLERYDIVVLSCECDTHDDTKPDKRPMHDWLNEGGKVFATHYHYTWFENGPAEFQKVANWSDAGLVLMVPGPFQADTSFPKGMSFNKWLGNVGALNANGTINLKASDVRTSMTTVNR